MGLFDSVRRSILGPELDEMRDRLRISDANLSLVQEQLLQETITELSLSIEDRQWIALNKIVGDFDRSQLTDIWALSRLMYLKNPLINRAVNLQSYYVWGQGWSIAAASPLVDERVQAFLDDPQNRAELTSHQARTLKEVDLQVYGNLFFVRFTDRESGAVQVRTIPCTEVTEIIANPDDRRDIWYYRREWVQSMLDEATGLISQHSLVTYYPDWQHQVPNGRRPDTIGNKPVLWESPIYHVKVGGLTDMQFGVPETYQAIDWARAYKSFLEDWATIVRAYARFAWYLRVPSKEGVAAAKARFGTTLGVGGSSGETNPPPVVGSMLIGQEGYEPAPIRTAGATTHADDARRLLLMVCAAMGLPETFFGDASTGTLATAKSLDRPTELKFRDRQMLWADIFRNILGYVVDTAQEALVNPLPKIDPETDEDLDEHLDITFPPILEHDVEQSVRAIVSAATLDGKPLAGTIPDMETLSRMLLTALGEQNTDELLAAMFPEEEISSEAKTFVAAIGELREAIANVIGGTEV